MKYINNVLFFIVIGVLSLSAQVQTQSAPELPSGPLINLRAPTSSSWTVSMKTAASDFYAQESSPDISSKLFMKTDKIVHVQLNACGAVWNIWNSGAFHVFTSPDNSYAQFAAAGANNPFYVDLSQSDFEGLAWINRSNFVGVQEVAGKKCLVFSAELRLIDQSPATSKNTDINLQKVPTYSAYHISSNAGGQTGGQASKFAQTLKSSQDAEQSVRSEIAKLRSRTFQYMAAVDFDTRLPVKELTPQGLRIFTFSKDVPAAQQLPAAVQNLINKTISHQTAMTTRVMAAY